MDIVKFQQLISDVTLRLERCKFHEAAKAIEEFIINHISQMYNSPYQKRYLG